MFSIFIHFAINLIFITISMLSTLMWKYICSERAYSMYNSIHITRVYFSDWQDWWLSCNVYYCITENHSIRYVEGLKSMRSHTHTIDFAFGISLHLTHQVIDKINSKQNQILFSTFDSYTLSVQCNIFIKSNQRNQIH